MKLIKKYTKLYNRLDQPTELSKPLPISFTVFFINNKNGLGYV